MIYTELTKKALQFMFEAHKDQKDKGGMPYVFHPYAVAEQMTDELTTVTALLHDVAEDTDYTIEDLERAGFPKRVCQALELLCHRKEVSYEDYIEAIKADPIAVKVKLADLAVNSDLTRLSEVGPKELARQKKYEKAKTSLLS